MKRLFTAPYDSLRDPASSSSLVENTGILEFSVASVYWCFDPASLNMLGCSFTRREANAVLPID